jgi:hypothetical protein
MSVIKQRQRAPTGISRRSIVITGSDCALLQAASLSLIIAAALINAENAFMCALKFPYCCFGPNSNTGLLLYSGSPAALLPPQGLSSLRDSDDVE